MGPGGVAVLQKLSPVRLHFLVKVEEFQSSTGSCFLVIDYGVLLLYIKGFEPL